MKFTWKHFLTIIEKTFEVNESKIAECLDVNKSTISRHKNGQTSNMRLGNKEIFEKLFSLENSTSLACEKGYTSEASLLYTLKQIIESEHLVEETKEIQNCEYRSYIMGLMRLARTNSPKSSKKGENISSNSTEYAPPKNSTAMNVDSKIAIPLQFQKCFYCEYFHIAETVHKKISNPLGTCTVHKQPIKSDSTACEYFEVNKGKIAQNMLIGKFSPHNFPL